MAYYAKVGSFNIDSEITAGNDQSVTGVGFQPKIVLFWWSGSTATVDTVSGGTFNNGFGAAISSTSRFCVMGISEDAVADSATYMSQQTTECIRCYANAGGTLDGIADFKSQDANGFTLTIDDQFSQDYRISFLALGGSDLTDIYIGNQQSPSSTGEYSVTSVGFQPDALIIASALLGSPDNASDYLQFSLGMATASSAQGVVAGRSDDAAAVSNTIGYGYNGEIYTRPGVVRETFVSFGANGFTLNHLEGGYTAYYHYVCLKGGQYLVGDLTTRTDGNDIEESIGFQPAAVLFASANRAHSTQDSPTAHNRISIGAATSASNRACSAISDEDDLADTETAYANYDTAVYAHVKDDAIEALMDLKSIDADGFICVMDDVETAGCWVTYLAIGATAAAGVPRQMDYYRRQRV